MWVLDRGDGNAQGSRYLRIAVTSPNPPQHFALADRQPPGIKRVECPRHHRAEQCARRAWQRGRPRPSLRWSDPWTGGRAHRSGRDPRSQTDAAEVAPGAQEGEAGLGIELLARPLERLSGRALTRPHPLAG